MTYYGSREMAEAFRTVRRNTLQIANDIPDDQYGFRVTPDTMTVAEELAHIACATLWSVQAHIVAALIKNGEEFANFLERLTPEQLAEAVSFPPPVQPSQKTRFEMLLGAKEHEMHHRAKLMVSQRLLGIVPHLTRARQQRQAAAPAR
jgi:uncharacterized damage-inducible protein DinB